MSLSSDVNTLRDATIAALSAAYDHFIFTSALWEDAGREIQAGGAVALDNVATGSRLTESNFFAVARASTTSYLPSATLQQIVSITETFLADLVRLWVTAHPAHLKGQVDVQAIVAAADKAAILGGIVDQYVNAMAYKRPTEWFKQLQSLVAIHHPSPGEIELFAEFKATRDVLVHNRGVASAAYIDKAGPAARVPLGLLLDVPDAYLLSGWTLCQKIVTDVGTAAAARA